MDRVREESGIRQQRYKARAGGQAGGSLAERSVV